VSQQSAVVSQQNIDQVVHQYNSNASIDGVQQGKFRAPGCAMGLAPVVYELWQKILRYDPRTRVARTATFCAVRSTDRVFYA